MYQILVTTNLVARGIDLRKVIFVINYDLPYNHEDDMKPEYNVYLHRIGRTGRYGDLGIALNLVDNNRGIKLLKKITKHFDIEKEMKEFPGFEVLKQKLMYIEDENKKK